MEKVYIATSILPESFGARTKTILKYNKLFMNNNIDTIIMTTNFNSNYEQIYEDYTTKNFTSKSQKYLNIYDWLRKRVNSDEKINDNYKDYLEKKNKYYYCNDDRITVIEKGPQIDIRLANENKLLERLFLDKNKNIYKINYYHGGEVYLERFFSNNFFCFLKIEIKKINDKKIKHNLKLIYEQKNIYFDSEELFFSFWFSKIFKVNDKVINNVRLFDYSLSLLDKDLKIVHIIHSNPFEKNIIKDSYKFLLTSNLEHHENIVTLDDNHKIDILNNYPNLLNNIKVIDMNDTKEELQKIWKNILNDNVNIGEV